MRIRKLGVLIFLVLFLCLLPPKLRAQGAVQELTITDIDSTGFPQIALQFRALDAQGKVVPGVMNDALLLTENGKDMFLEGLEVDEKGEGLWLHFVVDAGAGMTDERWQLTEEAILNFVRETPWMENDLDRVAVTVVEGGGPRTLIDYSSDAESVASVIEGYRPTGSPEFSDPLPVVANILDSIDLIEEARGKPQMVHLFTPGLENEQGRLDLVIEKAQDLKIPIYTTLVRENLRVPCPPPVRNEDGSLTTPACDEGLQQIARDSGGQFVHYTDSNSLNDTYREMSDQRLQYGLSYRTYLNESGTRQVQLTSASGGPTDVVANNSYDIEVNPPRVLIENPRDSEIITREAVAFTEDRGSIPPTTYTVVANVLFADNRRRLMRAALLVDGVVKDEITAPQENIELSWNLRDIQELGINDHSLKVEIEDELGIVSTSPPTTAKVEVIVPRKPTPVPVNTVTVEESVTRVVKEFEPVVATPIPCISPDPLCGNVERPVRSNPLAFTSLLIALASLVFAGVVWFNRDKAPVQAAMGSISSAVTRITKRIQRAEARAYLKVVAGDVNMGKVLEVYGDTPIGRSRQNAELIFQQDDEHSPLSRLHCTIVDEEDHFLLRDEDSANGTYLNGARLQPLVAEELIDGDEIELARVERGGVRLQFLLARIDDEMDDEIRVTKPTRKPDQKDVGYDDKTEVDRF